MEYEKKECIHISEILEQIKSALRQKNPVQLKALSNKTIHDACAYQDSGSITVAIIAYTLSKLVEREDYKKIRNWPLFVKKLEGILDLAIKSLKEENQELYQEYIQKARKVLESQSISLKPYIQDVLKKAAINKGSKLYDHGLSLEQTGKLLGVSQWELADYVGQRAHTDVKQNQTLNVKQRAKLALEILS